MLGFRASLTVLLVFLIAVSTSAIIINDKDGKGHALLPLASGQVGRINIVNIGDPNLDNSCAVKVTIFAGDGSVVGDPNIKEVRPGLTDFVDFSDRTIPLRRPPHLPRSHRARQDNPARAVHRAGGGVRPGDGANAVHRGSGYSPADARVA